MQLKIYKLSELAELEWIHYQTALQRAKSGKYVAVTFSVRQRTKSVEMTRYLSKADSEVILAAFTKLEDKDEATRSDSSFSELSKKKTKPWKCSLWLRKKHRKNTDSTSETR